MAPALSSCTCASLLVRPSAVQRPARRSVVVTRAAASGWDPSQPPSKTLAGKDHLVGNYGFDPLGLARSDELLFWYTQAELQNGRWAMLGVAGILLQELFHATGAGGPAAQVNWYHAGDNTYWAPESTLKAIAFFLFAFAEARRLQDMVSPGSANQDPIFTGNKVVNSEVGYPGFDPLSFSKGDMKSLKLKEIKNARLAMVAFLGFVAQSVAQGGSPLDNLSAHLADPWKNHFINNGVSLPFLTDNAHNILGGSL